MTPTPGQPRAPLPLQLVDVPHDRGELLPLLERMQHAQLRVRVRVRIRTRLGAQRVVGSGSPRPMEGAAAAHAAPAT